jgi:hypothetical protein
MKSNKNETLPVECFKVKHTVTSSAIRLMEIIFSIQRTLVLRVFTDARLSFQIWMKVSIRAKASTIVLLIALNTLYCAIPFRQ